MKQASADIVFILREIKKKGEQNEKGNNISLISSDSGFVLQCTGKDKNDMQG